MRKSYLKLLTTALVLVMVVASIAALAATRQVRILDGYEQNDSETHYAVYTIMEGEATEDGGIRSGKVVGEEKVAEPHTFDSDGYCTKCGYYNEPTVPPVPVNPDDEDDDDDTTTEGGTTEGGEETTTTFTTASGITVTTGAPAAETLKQVFAAIPANTEVSFKDVDAEVAEALVAAINGDASVEELLEILKKFPEQIVDGTPCYVVTISYVDADGKTVTENYAFSTADATLVKVF